MKNFDDVYKIVEESSHETAFNKEEAKALFDLLYSIPYKSTIVEIGVQFGRSSSVIAEVQKDQKFDFYAVDSWADVESRKAKEHFLNQVVKHGWDLHQYSLDSIEFSKIFDHRIDLLHIDGDHSYQGVTADAYAWVPKVKTGGYICFDDYEHEGLPDVTRAINDFMDKRDDIKFIDKYGNKLAVFRKL